MLTFQHANAQQHFLYLMFVQTEVRIFMTLMLTNRYLISQLLSQFPHRSDLQVTFAQYVAESEKNEGVFNQ